MNQSEHHNHHPSNVLGKFRLIAELGRGGMSEVYLAVVAGPAGFNKLLVVKLIKDELAEDPEFISMFLEEARLSARLNHPNIVQTNEVGQHNGRYFIAMEYLEGQPFSRIINRLGRDRGLPLGMGLRILSDVLSGLHYAHELRDFDGSALGVVHRDVTPHNVFITYDGQVKVVDFGIAKAMNSSHETRAGMLKGKVGYMAPEQARGERVDRRADVFSVGVMLWEVAVGRRMWKGMSEVQVLHQLMSGEIPRPRSMRPDISDRLESIIMKSLAIDREHRHASCLDLQADLDELMDGGSERTTLREVGRRVQMAFDDERQKLRQIIETQLAKSTNLPTGMYQQVELPIFEQQRMTGEHNAARPSYAPMGMPESASIPRLGPNSGSHPSHSGTPSWQHASHQSHPGTMPSVPSVFQQGPQPASYSHPHTPHSHSGNTGSIARANLTSPTSFRTSQPGPAAQSNRMTFVALAVAAAAAGLVALLYFSVGHGGLLGSGHNDKTSQAASAATAANAGTSSVDTSSVVASSSAASANPTSASPTSASPTSANPTSASPTSSASAAVGNAVSVKIAVKPKDAKIYLDDKKQSSSSFSLPKDDKLHQLRIEASGYVARTRDFTASDDLMWDLELSPEAHAARPDTGHPVVKKDPPPKEDDGKMTVSHPVRPVDTSYTP